MMQLKEAICDSPALQSIDYTSMQEVILAVDSSHIAVGWILSQVGTDGIHYPSHFGSIAWNEREGRYSQPKVELYGLFQALHTLQCHLFGVQNLTVELDAKYI